MRLLLIAVALFSISSTAYAQSITPTTVNSNSQIMQITGASMPFCFQIYLPETVEAQSYFDLSEMCIDDSYDGDTWANLIQDPGGDSFEGVYHFVLVNDGPHGVSACLNLSYEDCLTDPSYQGTTISVTRSLSTPSNNATWGSDNGFWGDVTTTDIRDSLQASVQSTGLSLWPLFAFVGIGLAFVIAGMLVMNIEKQTTATRSKKLDELKDGVKSDFIYHSADDLEFKRNYGQEEPRRKRGRPRKNPL